MTAASEATSGERGPDEHRLGSISAVILSWNTPDYTLRSARALLADGLPPERLVVVDNGSTDGSADRFERELPDCKLVQLAENLGSTRGNNEGARALPSDAILFVNSDAFLHRPGSIRALADAARRPSVGIAVPRLLNEDLTLQPNVVPLYSPAVALVRASGLSRFLPNRLQPRWSTHWDHASSGEVEAASGAVTIVRREAWDELGGFGEDEYMYGEDLDLCWRASQLGWKTWFAGEAEFVHIGKASASQTWSDPARAARIGRAEAAMIRAQLAPLSATATIALIAAGVAVRSAVWRVAGQRERSAESAGMLRGLLATRRRPGVS